MPWNGSGVINRLYSWVADKNAGIDITASRTDADTNDIVSCIENTVTLDGQTTPVHSLPMGGFTHTGVGNATLRTNYAAAGQVQDSSLIWGGTSGGSANAQTIALTPAVTALAAGQQFGWIAGFSNTGAMTLTANATAATAVRKPSSSGPVALSGGEIVTGNFYRTDFDGTYHILRNPTNSSATLRGYIGGLTLSTAGASTTFGISAGVATDSTFVSLMSLASAYTKTTASWVVGTGNGSLDTGAIAPSTWYHAYLIQRPDTGVVDVLVSLSATSPTMPANYTLFRRIGSMKTDGSSHWIAFSQNGDKFLWITPINDVNVANLSTVVTDYTLTVPPGVVLDALFGALATHASALGVVLFSAVQTGITAWRTPTGAVSLGGGSLLAQSGEFQTQVNTSAQIAAVAASSSTSLEIATRGWLDRRGRDA